MIYTHVIKSGPYNVISPIFDLIEKVKQWLENSGHEFLIDTKMFRLVKKNV